LRRRSRSVSRRGSLPEIEDPEVVEGLSHEAAHAGEAGAAQVRRGGDETDDAATRCALEHLPEGPAPEVDIEVVEVLRMDARHVPQEISQDAVVAAVAPSDPPSLALHAHVTRLDHLPEVGRVADADENRHPRLDAPRPLVLLRELPVEQRSVSEARRSEVRRLERVREIDVHPVGG